MARGINVFVGNGNVAGPVYYNNTEGNNDPACSFVLIMDQINGKKVRSTRTRINIFGDLVRICEQKLRVGGYVTVKGELMNREKRKSGEEPQLITEVRGLDIVFVN